MCLTVNRAQIRSCTPKALGKQTVFAPHNGRRRDRPAGGDLTPLATQWLGHALGKALSELWDDGLWIPHEAPGLKPLRFL